MKVGHHPCYNAEDSCRYGRIHLPVASRCNLACVFCNRRYACLNESRPGVTCELLTPEEACASVGKALAAMPNLTVAGIAGPGDPLANPHETFETFRLVRRQYPDLLLCLATNGLALPDAVATLLSLGVRHITVTVNAVNPVVGARIYRFVQDGEQRLSGEEGAQLLLERQRLGVRSLSDAGLLVKINTVVVPGLNDEHVADIAKEVASWGAYVMNCIPLIPVAGTPLAGMRPPTRSLMDIIRREAGSFLRQMTHYSRCRADAVGFLAHSTVVKAL